MSKYAKMASETPNFDFRNRFYNSFCIILSPLLLNLTHFITHFFYSKNAHPCAPASVPKGRRKLLLLHPRDSSAKTEKGLGNVDPRKKEKSRLRPSLRSFFSL